MEKVRREDERVALPRGQALGQEECGGVGQGALDLGSEPAAGMGCLGRQQLPVEPGRTVGTDLAFERQVRPADQRQPHLAIVPVPAAQFDDRAAWCIAGPFRSEEHTSELQTLMRISYAVFCLKKKTHTYTIHKSKQ